MGRAVILIVAGGAYGPAAVAVAASISDARAEEERRLLEIRRDMLEEVAIRGVGRLDMPDLEKLEPMADYRHDDRKWVSMNLAHQRRAGLRSSAIPRVICPA